MSVAELPKLMTLEEFLALPEDDGVERELIRGQLREKPMTRRNRWHARAEAKISRALDVWATAQPEPQGEVLSGEVGCIIRRDPDSAVGIDVAYFSADTIVRQTDETTMVVGPPVLAVEVLSPSDKQEEIKEKVGDYLASGIALVWIVDPYFKTVVVHRPDGPPKMFNSEERITAEPHLPGFSAAVAELVPG